MISVTTHLDEIIPLSHKEAVSLLFTGDFCPDAGIGDLIEDGNIAQVFGDFMNLAPRCDLSLTNLECPLTNSHVPILKDGPVLRGNIKSGQSLRNAGFNTVCLANNHIMDMGVVGFEDTVRLLRETGHTYTGAGRNLSEALVPLVTKVKGLKLGIINIAEVEFSIAGINEPGAAPLDLVENMQTIEKCREDCDILILVIHGGHEFYSLPSPRMKKTYRFFADLGVDAIIGHHAHAFTGYEIYKDVPIFYNLGNFLFDRKENREVWYKGYAVHLTVEKDGIKAIKIIPYIQCRNGAGIDWLKGVDLENFIRELSRINDIIADDDELDKEFQKFIINHRIDYLAPLLGLNKIERQLVRMNLFTKYLIPKRKILNGLSMARCQSHRDAFIEVLKQELR